MPTSLRYIIIAVTGGMLFLPFLGHVHLFDWDEVNFAECAREMIVSKDYLRAQIDFMPFWEKPPLFIWMQVISMKLFGIGEYAARLPNALTGIATLITLFYVGKRIANDKVAMWWTLLYAATWLPHFYFKSGIIDPLFNFFIFVSFFQVHLVRSTRRAALHSMLAGLFLGLAVLTKGPVAILIALLSFGVYIILNRGIAGYKVKHLLLIVVCAALPMLGWLGAAIATHGMEYGKWFMTEFISYQARLFSTEDADHGGPFFYHFIVLLFGCFPASIFLFQYSRKRPTDSPGNADFTRWMWLLFGVVLLLFSIVKTKIVHYSSLCYFPLTYLAALQLHRLSEEQDRIKKGVKVTLLVVGTLLAIFITALPLVGIFKAQLVPYINDPFAVGNLQANVSWGYAECLWGIVYLIAIWVCAMMMKRNFRRGVTVLCVAQLIIIEVTVLHFTPKIEGYSQNAAIEYFKRFEGKNVYVQPLGYKSYANLFYTMKTANTDAHYNSFRTDAQGRQLEPIANEQWLLSGAVDRPVYFICKIQDAPKYDNVPQLEKTGASNGFVFYRRKQ